MATRSTPKHHPKPLNDARTSRPRSPWVTLAGVMLAITGVANLVWGLGALRSRAAAPADATAAWLDQATVGPLQFWGWASLVWAGVLLVTSGLVLTRSDVAQIAAVPVVAMSMAFWLLTMPVFPMFSLAALLLDAFVMYAILVRWDDPPS